MRISFPLHRNSLFVKLLTGFLAVIVLLVSFNVLSFTFFKTNISNKIIEHNTLILKNTVDRYENQFRLVESSMLRFYFNDRLRLLFEYGDQMNYDAANVLKTDMNAVLSNEMLLLNNFFIMSRNRSIVLEKGGVEEENALFSKYYVSDAYSPTFWRQQLDEDYTSRVFPAAEFVQYSFDKSVKPLGKMFPFVIKNKFTNQYMIAALLDADAMFQTLHIADENRFLIMNDKKMTLYQSLPVKETVPDTKTAAVLGGATITTEQGHFDHQNSYYFYMRGSISGLTYVNVIPVQMISNQVERLTMVLLSLLVAAVLLSIAISVLLSVKFNNPIQRMLELVQSGGVRLGVRSKIREFELISSNISYMMDANKALDRDLSRKNKILQNYGYISKINNTYQWNDIHELLETSKPFYMVVFQLTFTEQFRRMAAEDQAKASHYMKEFIHFHVGERFGDAVTVQMEKNSVSTLIFSAHEPQDVQIMLTELKEVFDRDRQNCCLTISFVPILRTHADISSAYEETQAMIQNRMLGTDTQIITKAYPEEDVYLLLSGREQELYASLQLAQEAKAVDMVIRILHELEERQSSACQFIRFGKEATMKVIKALLAHNVDISGLLNDHNPFQRVEACASREEYEALFRGMIGDAVRLIREKKEGQDPIRDFVFDYVKEHYGEDISLELMADKLNLTRSYLSTYFREKTGMTFTDYLNELRISRAKEMLLDSEARIQEVAMRIGYHNVNSFIRMFKRISGQTPGEFRRVAGQGELSG